MPNINLKHLGDKLPTGQIRLYDTGRDYRRIRQTAIDVLHLETLGFTEVMSSNVSAVGRQGNDLLIRFHNEAVYRYFNAVNLYEPMLRSNSKGKFVWAKLRRPGVPYRLDGKLEVPTGTKIDLDYKLLDLYYRDAYKRTNIPVQDSSEKMGKFLEDLNKQEVDLVDMRYLLNKE